MSLVKIRDCSVTVTVGATGAAAHALTYTATIFQFRGSLRLRAKNITPIGSKLDRYIFGNPGGQFIMVLPQNAAAISPQPDGTAITVRTQIASGEWRDIPGYIVGKIENWDGPNGVNYDVAYQIVVGSDSPTATIVDNT